jgi:phosphatidylglycerophosphatase A
MTSPQEPQNLNNAIREPSLLIKLFATGLFSGYSPVASGTAGSLVAFAIYCIPGFESPYTIGIVTVSTFLLGIPAASIMERRYGHDPSQVTIDEVVGMWIALIFLPKTLIAALSAFFLFRFFDIVKPFPARRFDNIHGGFGIMMDDVVAGIYANLLTRLVIMLT